MFAPAILCALMDLRAKSHVVHVAWCMDSHLDPLLVLMIETPLTVHTHSRSSLYIYIKCLSTFNSGYSHKGVAPALLYAPWT